MITICRQIGATACDPELWSNIADLFDRGFIQSVPAAEFKRMVDRLPADATTLRALATLFATMQPGITAEQALAAHLSVLPCLAQVFDRPFAMHRLILVPFVVDYWNAIFRRMRFRFGSPELVEAALADAATKPFGVQIQAILRAILIGIPLRLAPESTTWLDASDGS